MANLCSNYLTVKPASKKKEALEQFLKFVEDVRVVGVFLDKVQAEEKRKTFLEEEATKKYRNDLNLYVEHSKMPIDKFMTSVLYFNKIEDGKFEKGTMNFSMNKLHPIPKDYFEECKNEQERENHSERMMLKYGYSTLRDWLIENWGTKSDVGDADIVSQTKTNIKYYFSTAWSPIVAFLANINEKYPLVNFNLRYDEPAMGFKGQFEICNGEVIKDKYIE